MDTDERRLRLLLRHKGPGPVGYALPIISLILLKVHGFASYSCRSIVITIRVSLSRAISCVIIKNKASIPYRFAERVLWFELANWMLIFSYLTSFLNEIRLAALFFAFIRLIFLLTKAEFLASLALTPSIILSYSFISYIQIAYGQQVGSLPHELQYVVFFSIAAVYLSIAAGIFKRQRQKTVEAKRRAEKADERKIKQIMYNLLSNAIKFTLQNGCNFIKGQRVAAGKGNLPSTQKIGAHPIKNESNEGDLVEFAQIAVSDTGIRLYPAHLNCIFNTFDPVENSRFGIGVAHHQAIGQSS